MAGSSSGCNRVDRACHTRLLIVQHFFFRALVVNAPEDILNHFKITVTEKRVALLKLILSTEKQLFSVKDLSDRIRANHLTMSNNTLVTTLLMFVTRKLLHAYPSSGREGKRGRPAMLYRVDPSVTQRSSDNTNPGSPL